jgi:hypothetical protein
MVAERGRLVLRNKPEIRLGKNPKNRREKFLQVLFLYPTGKVPEIIAPDSGIMKKINREV